jgi:hypothetical protein
LPGFGVLLLMPLLAPPAQTWNVGQAQVDAAIETGKRALLEQVSEYDAIEYRDPEGGGLKKVRGRVTRRVGPVIVIEPLSGGSLRIPRQNIVTWTMPGHVHPEMSGQFAGGPSALAAFALLSAGVETTNPTLTLLLDALAQDDAKPSGTYVHSLRACVWSALLERPITSANRKKYWKLLNEDMSWLTRAMHPDGGYTYTAVPGEGWDNSNTQFGNLGLWAGSVAGVEVADKYWLAMARHWKETQIPSGAWNYSGAGELPRSSMTVAGCNSLYIVLDRYYSRADGAYALFKGVLPKAKARKEMQAIHDAIDRGDKFLEIRPPDIRQSYGYELFGLERLGLASGMAVIGGEDWFRRYVGDVAYHDWGENGIADAFALIFLVHGQAPVLIQKLEHGKKADDWDFYNRDIFALTRYLSRTFERLHRWQRVPPDASLGEMLDAPVLYVSGSGTLDLPQKTLKRIQQYVERGGTVFLHADRAGPKFVKSAATTFEKLFADWDCHFKELDETHPLYTCHFDCREGPGKKRVPLRAMCEGPRILVLLCPVDIAGAWQQERLAKFPMLFQIMANVRVYVAPPFGKLPTRLRADPLAGNAARPRGNLSLRRLPHAGSWNAHPGAWQRFAAGLQHRTGLSLEVEDAGESASVEGLAQFDVVHLTVRRSVNLDETTIAAMRAYLQGGGLLLIDAADGQPEAVAAVGPLLDAIEVGEKGILPADHPLATGGFPGGQALKDLETTKAGASLSTGGAPPPMLTRTIDGRVAVLACPFDLTAGIDGTFIWNRSGYEPASTARIVDNVLLWRSQQVNAQAKP